jgi:glycosyltransferase involved in cell wall biosynthesis
MTGMADAPTVSVVMTVYNTRRFVADAVRSVLGQTFGDFEFIIVDDGSTDGSAAVLKDFAANDPRIRLVSRPNTGIVAAANEGIGLARGRYLARMDSDDVCLPRRFATQVGYLDEHPECVLVGSRVTVVDPYGSPVFESGQKLTHEEIDAELLSSGGGWAIVQPSAMMRTDAVRRVGGYRGRHNVSEDQDLFLRLAEVGRVANLPEPLLLYRRHYRSVMHTQWQQRQQVKERIVREAYERRGLPMPADWKFDDWRPAPLAEQLRAWGWAALKRGNVPVARKHALAAVRSAPASAGSWKLLYCALRGR